MQGSLEAVTESLRKLGRDEVDLTFVHRAVGGITENDITLAATTNATIIGFNVRPDRKARELADSRGRRDPHLRDHLQAARGHRAGDGRHAGARVRRGRHRRRRGARDLPGAQDRRHRRLLRAERASSPAAPRSASSATARSSGRARSRRSAGSRTMRTRSAPASSAVSGCPTSRTSSPATSSRPSTSARSPAPEHEHEEATDGRATVRRRRVLPRPGLPVVPGSPHGGSPTCRPRSPTTVGWRFISLFVLNEGTRSRRRRCSPRHEGGLRALRVADQVRIDHGNDGRSPVLQRVGHADPRRQAP